MVKKMTKQKMEDVTEQAMSRIYSQASNDVVIPSYKKREDKDILAANVIESAIIIKGGANVAFSAANKHSRKTKWAITEVTQDELKTLKNHPGFMRRVDRGFITIDKEPEVLMADKSSQMNESDLKDKLPGAKVKTGKAQE